MYTSSLLDSVQTTRGLPAEHAPSACDPLEEVKQSPPTRFARSALLLSVLAQKYLARLEMYSEA